MPKILKAVMVFAKEAPVYQFDMSKHYKVWFSSDPEMFMNPHNIKRLIKTRAENKAIELNLIYSSAILNVEALDKLKDFARKHNIKILDIDNDEELGISQWHEQDAKILRMVRTEIAMYKKDGTGSLAAASDMMRVIAPIVQRCGVYSDMDVKIAMQGWPAKVEISRPIVLSLEIDNNRGAPYWLNNDFVAFALQNGKLQPHALEKLRELQSKLIARYSNVFSVLEGNVFYKSTAIEMDLFPLYAFKASGREPNIYAFRKFVQAGQQRLWAHHAPSALKKSLQLPEWKYDEMTDENYFRFKILHMATDGMVSFLAQNLGNSYKNPWDRAACYALNNYQHFLDLFNTQKGANFVYHTLFQSAPQFEIIMVLSMVETMKSAGFATDAGRKKLYSLHVTNYFKFTVSYFSGPNLWDSCTQDLNPKLDESLGHEKVVEQVKKSAQAMKSATDKIACRFKRYKPLSPECIEGDASWLPDGKAALAKKDAEALRKSSEVRSWCQVVAVKPGSSSLTIAK